MPLEHVPQRSAIWLRGAAFAANYVKNSLIPDSDRLRAEAPDIGLRPLQGNAINCIPTWAPSLSPIANKNPQEPDLEARGEALLYAAISRWPVNSIYRMKPLATAAAFYSLVSLASIRL